MMELKRLCLRCRGFAQVISRRLYYICDSNGWHARKVSYAWPVALARMEDVAFAEWMSLSCDLVRHW
jgi:hypothetical protein